ncbi:MAG: hypothetical protein V5A23_04010 [Halobacteriales archaeon]
MVSDLALATAALVVVSASFPVFLKGAGVVLNAETVTWEVLVRHLTFIGIGLTLTTVPILVWMLPRFSRMVGARRLLFVHTFLGVQAYALLLFAMTGIYRVFTEKRRAERYRDPDPDDDLNDLHPNMSAWRGRIRLGVFGFLFFWLLTYVAGVVRFWLIYF